MSKVCGGNCFAEVTGGWVDEDFWVGQAGEKLLDMGRGGWVGLHFEVEAGRWNSASFKELEALEEDVGFGFGGRDTMVEGEAAEGKALGFRALVSDAFCCAGKEGGEACPVASSEVYCPVVVCCEKLEDEGYESG